MVPAKRESRTVDLPVSDEEMGVATSSEQNRGAAGSQREIVIAGAEKLPSARLRHHVSWDTRMPADNPMSADRRVAICPIAHRANKDDPVCFRDGIDATK